MAAARLDKKNLLGNGNEVLQVDDSDRGTDEERDNDEDTLEEESGAEVEIIAGDKANPKRFIKRQKQRQGQRNPESSTSPPDLLQELLGSTSPIAMVPSHANRIGEQQRDFQTELNEDGDEIEQLDEDIMTLNERMLMNQMPRIGNLKSARLIDIRNNIRAF